MPPLTLDNLKAVCREFTGEIRQKVPAYSAVRIGGVRSYELARAGKEIPARVRNVEVRELEVTGVDLPDVEFNVTCSKGTYIRTLCADIGEKLGCGGHMKALRRTRIGAVTVDRAVTIERASVADLLPSLP